MPRLPRRSDAASRASRRRLNQSKRATQCHLSYAATQNDGRCEVVPRLPREIKVDVTKCHACHARLPRKTTVDVRLCHDCHVKSRWMSPSARLPRRSDAASRASRRRLNQSKRATPVPSVPRRPRKTTVDVRLCHACHMKSRWMSPSATPATQKWRGVTGVTAAPKPVQARHPVPSVPRRPRKTTVDVRLCHACHVKSRWMSPSATPATQSGAASRASRRRLNQSKRATQCHLSHAGHHKTTVDVTFCHA